MHFSTHVLGNFPNCLAISWNALEILAILQLPRHFWKCLITTNPCNTCINGIKNIGVTLETPVFARHTPMGKIVRSHKNGFGLARSYQTLTSTQRSDAPPFAVCKTSDVKTRYCIVQGCYLSFFETVSQKWKCLVNYAILLPCVNVNEKVTFYASFVKILTKLFFINSEIFMRYSCKVSL